MDIIIAFSIILGMFGSLCFGIFKVVTTGKATVVKSEQKINHFAADPCTTTLADEDFYGMTMNDFNDPVGF